jgi:glycosyltransferase involved in cell wall biosynthesis
VSINKINKGFNNLIATNSLAKDKIKVSLCMIVKNEQERLANCLKSSVDFVDEFIIVDTGSSDRTVSIAKKFGASLSNSKISNFKLSKFEWCDDFAAARNYALNQAQGEWILVLDADEVLERSIIPTLQTVINNSEYLAINLNRAEIDSGRSPHSFILRLFRRHPDIYFSGFYHESVDRSLELLTNISTNNKARQIITIDRVAIHHHGYKVTSIENLNRKRELAQRLMEKQLTIDPNDAYIHSKLGALYVEINEVEKGLTLLKTGLDLIESDNSQLPTLFELNYHLGIAYSHLQNWKLAIMHYQQALELDVIQAIKLPAYNNLGNLYQAQNNFSEAITCYEKLLEIAPDFATGYFNLGVARKSVYDFSGAIAAYLKALEINPQYAEGYQNLAVALQQTGKIEASKIAFTEAIRYHRLQNRPEVAQQLQNYLSEPC